MEEPLFTIRISVGKKERTFYVYKDMLVRDLCCSVCDFLGCRFSVDTCWLRKGTCQLEPCAALVYEVSPNDLLQFKRRRTHGTGKTAPNRVQSRWVWAQSDNRRQRLALQSWIRAFRFFLPPLELEPEGEESARLELTVTHHVMLENAASELDALSAELDAPSDACQLLALTDGQEESGLASSGAHDGAAGPSTSLNLSSLAAAGGPWDCPTKRKRKARVVRALLRFAREEGAPMLPSDWGESMPEPVPEPPAADGPQDCPSPPGVRPPRRKKERNSRIFRC